MTHLDNVGHFRAVCREHDVTLTQCRCPDHDKPVQKVNCPGRTCPGYTETDPRDNVPEALKDPGASDRLLDLLQSLAALPEPESEDDLLANAMQERALLFKAMDSMPHVQYLLTRGAAAIRRLATELHEEQGKRIEAEAFIGEVAAFEARTGERVDHMWEHRND